MKNNLFLIITVALSLLFCSCRNDEVFKPKSKILEIYDLLPTNSSPENPYLRFYYDDNEKITKIDLKNNNVFFFYYNSDNTVSKISNYVNNELYSYVLIKYEKSYASEIEYYHLTNGVEYLYQKSIFTRKGNLLENVKTFATSLAKTYPVDSFYKDILFTSFFQMIDPKYYSELSSDKSDLQLIYLTATTFNDDNVVKTITFFNNNVQIEESFTFDTSHNPFQGLPFPFTNLLNIPYHCFANYNHNNPVSFAYSENNLYVSSQYVRYVYAYNTNNYPINMAEVVQGDTVNRWRFVYKK